MIISIFLFYGCNDNNSINSKVPKFDSDTSSYFRIYENASKGFYLNGNIISLLDLEKRISVLAEKKGLIYYSCVTCTENPPREGSIFDLIRKYKIGIKMFEDSTFTKSFY